MGERKLRHAEQYRCAGRRELRYGEVRYCTMCRPPASAGMPPDRRDPPPVLFIPPCYLFDAEMMASEAQTLTALRPKYEFIQYDCEAIERQLLENPRGQGLAARYTPVSFNKWMIASQMIHTPAIINDPQHSINHFFLRHPHVNLTDALIEASARNIPLFIVIYDPEHPSNSRIELSLGYFMEYHTTKKLVDQNFVAVVVPNLTPEIIALIPADDPLEKCLWVVMQPNGDIIRREGVYANPDEGMKRVRAVITSLGL